MPCSPSVLKKAVSAGRAAEGGEEAASRARCLLSALEQALDAAQQTAGAFSAAADRTAQQQVSRAAQRLSMPGANFMPTNTAASLPSVEATCGPLFAR